MEVILLEQVNKLGALGEQVTVKPGYGRNYLIPSGKAALATPENVEKFEARRAELEQAQADALSAARTQAEKIDGLALTLQRKTSSGGKLFGSVGAGDIVEAAAAADVTLSRQAIRLPDGPFKQVGEYEVEVHLRADVDAMIKLTVVSENEPQADADAAAPDAAAMLADADAPPPDAAAMPADADAPPPDAAAAPADADPSP